VQNVFVLRADRTIGQLGIDAAEAFLAHFSAGSLRQARSLAAPGFRWFGRPATEAVWRSYFDRAPSRYGDVRAVPRECLRSIPTSIQRQLFDDVLNATDIVVLADLERRGYVATAGLVIDCATPKSPVISRLFDPGPVADYLRALERPRP
jgi:hypothetical protein